MDSIEEVRAREILDSRGYPTLEVEVVLEDGTVGWAAVPSGASTGAHEALELRDSDSTRFSGRGVLKAVRNIQDVIAPAIIGLSALEQEALDQRLLELDGTPDKSHLGANALLGVSLATAHVAANYLGLPLYRYLGGMAANTLPLPMLNILNGGKHAPGGADFQEFLIVPVGESFSHSLRIGAEVYYSLKALLQERGLSVQVGDEGGFAPRLDSNRQGLELVLEAIGRAGWQPGENCFLALDIAASQLYRDGKYLLPRDQHAISTRDMVDYYEDLAQSFPLVSLEDGLDEEDWQGWRLLTERLGKRLLIVGDDLYATNPQRLAQGIAQKASTAILVKPNQIGTLTETVACVRLAQQAGFTTVISHRSGETEDTTIADLSVGLGCPFIKAGAPCRSERLAKYNRLLRIEEELGPAARFAGKKALTLFR